MYRGKITTVQLQDEYSSGRSGGEEGSSVKGRLISKAEITSREQQDFLLQWKIQIAPGREQTITELRG